MLKTQLVEYKDEDVLLEGFVAYDDNNHQKRPAILIVHDWSGRNELTKKRAQDLAELGYVGFAIDMFGKGISGNTKEEKQALVAPFFKDRNKLKQRMLAAFNTAKTLPNVDQNQIGVMGYCFGGTCALDLARSGADLKAAISLHGGLAAPEKLEQPKIKAKILVLHGFDDPMVTPDQVMLLGEEMTHAKVDWQVVIYGNAMHAFTNPLANDPGFGTLYDKKADTRSWIEVVQFLKETFTAC